MKKIFSVFLISCLILSNAGCLGIGESDNSSNITSSGDSNSNFWMWMYLLSGRGDHHETHNHYISTGSTFSSYKEKITSSFKSSNTNNVKTTDVKAPKTYSSKPTNQPVRVKTYSSSGFKSSGFRSSSMRVGRR